MCRRIDCSKCGKPTWTGCGMHIEQALAGVPKHDRCRCAEQKSVDKAAGSTSGESKRSGIWSLFSK